MKGFTFILLILSLMIFKVHAQSCKQINVTDTLQRRILGKYINECIKERYFFDDKGVVSVTRFTNKSGHPVWLIRSVVDDRYKDNPPSEWAKFGQDIILFYDARTRYDVLKNEATPELLHCLSDAIGDRLYIRPLIQDRWVDVAGPDGKVHKRKARRIFGGNTSNEKIVTFEADGTVKLLQTI